MLLSLHRAEAFLRTLTTGRVPAQVASLAALHADELAARRRALGAALGIPPPPDGPGNGSGERGEAARGAEPRPAVLTHAVAIDFGAARVLCPCGHTFALRDARELTHFVACPKCMHVALGRVENLRRAAFYGAAGAPELVVDALCARRAS